MIGKNKISFQDLCPSLFNQDSESKKRNNKAHIVTDFYFPKDHNNPILLEEKLNRKSKNNQQSSKNEESASFEFSIKDISFPSAPNVGYIVIFSELENLHQLQNNSASAFENEYIDKSSSCFLYEPKSGKFIVTSKEEKEEDNSKNKFLKNRCILFGKIKKR